MASSPCLSERASAYDETADSTFGAQRGAAHRMQSKEDGAEERQRLHHRVPEVGDGGSRHSGASSGVEDGRAETRRSVESASSSGRRRLPATPAGPANLLLLPHVLGHLPPSRLTTPMCSSTVAHRDDQKQSNWRSSGDDGSQKVAHQSTAASPARRWHRADSDVCVRLQDGVW